MSTSYRGGPQHPVPDAPDGADESSAAEFPGSTGNGLPMASLPLHAMPGHLIRRIHQQALALYAARTVGFDLTPAQYAALHAIGGCPDSDQVGIARAIACDKATVGAVIDRLQAKGLIVRTADASDRRVRRLQLTEAGRDLLQKVEPAVMQMQRDLLAPLDAQQARQLMSLLEILAWPGRQPGRSS